MNCEVAVPGVGATVVISIYSVEFAVPGCISLSAEPPHPEVTRRAFFQADTNPVFMVPSAH
jgi:hypothetical protein